MVRILSHRKVTLLRDEPFHYSSIQNILRNIMYMGILRSEDTQSEIFPDLQIITLEQFSRVQRGQEQRAADYEEKCAAAWEPQSPLRTRAKPALYAHPASGPKGMPVKHFCPGIYSAAIAVAAFLRLRSGSHTIPPQRKKQSAPQSTNAIIAASINKIATVHPPIRQRKWMP